MAAQQINRQAEVTGAVKKMRVESRSKAAELTQELMQRAAAKVGGKMKKLTEMSLGGIWKAGGIRHWLPHLSCRKKLDCSNQWALTGINLCRATKRRNILHDLHSVALPELSTKSSSSIKKKKL